jgi:hypothetical protein
MGGKYDFDQVKDFAHILMKQVNEKYLKLLLWKEVFKKEIPKKFTWIIFRTEPGKLWPALTA